MNNEGVALFVNDLWLASLLVCNLFKALPYLEILLPAVPVYRFRDVSLRPKLRAHLSIYKVSPVIFHLATTLPENLELPKPRSNALE